MARHSRTAGQAKSLPRASGSTSARFFSDARGNLDVSDEPCRSNGAGFSSPPDPWCGFSIFDDGSGLATPNGNKLSNESVEGAAGRGNSELDEGVPRRRNACRS